MFIRRVFVSHYLNIPYHLLLNKELYPIMLIEELYAASSFLMRNFELAPFATDDLEDALIKRIEDGKL